MITKEEIQKISQKNGDARGVVFQTDADYIMGREGKDGLKKLEGQLKDWGIGLNYQEVAPMSWIPVAWRAIHLLAIKEVFAWSDDDIRKMGENAPRVSIVVKLFFKLFPDIGKFAAQIPHYWAKHYTVGSLEVVKLDKENKEMILHLKDFAFHPILCKYLEGYFETATKLTRSKDSVVTTKELQCSFRDNIPYQVYQIKWTE